MKHIVVALSLFVLAVPAAAGDDYWWHGTFVPTAQFPDGCSGSDSKVTFSSKAAEYSELSCEITQKTDIRGMSAVVLDLRCSGIDGEEDFDRQELLMSQAEDIDGNQSPKVFAFPPMQPISRCP